MFGTGCGACVMTVTQFKHDAPGVGIACVGVACGASVGVDRGVLVAVIRAVGVAVIGRAVAVLGRVVAVAPARTAVAVMSATTTATSVASHLGGRELFTSHRMPFPMKALRSLTVGCITGSCNASSASDVGGGVPL
jgi:hypothetical protein